ncbi:MAG: hypothetical protein SPJ01_05740, partial [Butyricicoccus sp.]|nr:hypothetical protein [Butyricicoccus sp.]
MAQSSRVGWPRPAGRGTENASSTFSKVADTKGRAFGAIQPRRLAASRRTRNLCQNPVFGPDFDTMKIRNRPAVQAGRFFSIIPHFYRCPNKFQANQKCGRKKPSQPNGTDFYIKTKNP